MKHSGDSSSGIKPKANVTQLKSSELFDPEKRSTTNFIERIKAIDLETVQTKFVSFDGDETFKTVGQSYDSNIEDSIEEDSIIDSAYAGRNHAIMSQDEGMMNPHVIHKFFDVHTYFVHPSADQICLGDLLVLYENLQTVLQRNITYSKYLLQNNEVNLIRFSKKE
jgi:hypothetical protein